MNRYNYSNAELADMHFVYGLVNGNSLRAIMNVSPARKTASFNI